MNPLLMLMLAIIAPVLMATTLLLPIYAGLISACYLIYSKSGQINPLADKLGDVGYMVDVYRGLYSQWAQHMESVDFWTYTVPLLVLPIAGLLFAFWLTRKLMNKLKNLFQHNMSI